MKIKYLMCALNALPNQRGAMFGLDARISLAIFAILSVVAGSYAVLSLNDINAKSLAQELRETGEAIEAIHNDLESDIYSHLMEESDSNAYISLYDKSVLEDGPARARWLGPYIKATSPTHAKFGEVSIQRRLKEHGGVCFAENECYLWLVYSKVPLKTAEHLNKIFDGNNEGIENASGIIQWDTLTDSLVTLWYRASIALSGSYGRLY